MAVDQTKLFYIDGFPVTYPQIEEWYEKYKDKTPKHIRRLPDPFFSEKACWFIAGEILKEFQKPLKQKIFDTNKKEINSDYNKTSTALKKSDYWDDDPVIFGDTDDVIKKTMEDLEKEYRAKQEQEALRQKQNAEFWKNQQSQSKQNYNKKPEPPKEEIINWRKILNIPQGVTITVDIIKKAYRKEALKRHPDRGGSLEKMMELFKARDTACYIIGEDPHEHFR